MAAFEDEPKKKASVHEIGQDLSALSLHELDERMAVLQIEVDRLSAAKAKKAASMAVADSIFKAKN
jgi:uncharacterized small protein (DUF1192 family)